MVGHEVQCAVKANASAVEVDILYLLISVRSLHSLEVMRSYLAHAYPLHCGGVSAGGELNERRCTPILG
jgi:hypothetical protein